jgi:hypothetical protein
MRVLLIFKSAAGLSDMLLERHIRIGSEERITINLE